AARRGIRAGHQAAYRRPARDLCDARRRRAAHAGPLLHVRREAGGPGRVDLAALGRRARRQTRFRKGGGGPGGGEPEGSGGRVPRRAPRHPRRRPQAAGELRARGRRRGGDRLAALPPDRAPAGGARGAAALGGHLHAGRRPGARWTGDDHARRQGRDRVRAGLERRALGPRAAPGHSLEQQGTRGQPRVAPGAGARDAGVIRRERACDRRLSRQGTSDLAGALVIKVQETVYRRSQIDPIVLPRNAGSWTGYVFTGDPLRLPAGHFGLGHGSGAHAPDEYYLIESATPKVQGLDGAVRSYVEYLYEVARVG